MAGYTPYMMNPMNYAMMTPYQYQTMQQTPQMFTQQNMNMPMYGQQGGQMQVQRQDFIGAFVNNFEDVKGFPVPLGGTVMLMEKGSNKFYMKTIDNNGNPMINTYVFQDLSINTDGNKTEQVKSEQNTSDVDVLRKDVTNAMREVDNRLRDLESKVNKTEQRGAVKA